MLPEITRANNSTRFSKTRFGGRSKLFEFWLRLVLPLCFPFFPAAHAAPPVEFQNQFVLGLEQPISLAFLPDGRMLVLQKEGKIQIADPRIFPVQASEVLTLTNIDSDGERGLLDITLDPDFQNNGFFYLYYSAALPPRLRVSRFTFTGDTSSLASEVNVWEAPEDYDSCCHYGGGLDVGPDGMLYLTVGDQFFVQNPGTVSAVAQDLSRIPGSVLRLGPDGSIPADNPFVDVPGARPEIWAYGLRNPFRARWDLPTGRFFIGDVGGNVQEIAREEINLGMAGANFGWPDCEGPTGNPDYPDCNAGSNTDPLFSYPHASSQGSVTAGFVYRGATFPATYGEVFFYGDFVHQHIRYLTFDATGTQVTGDFEFEPTAGSVIFLGEGPGGELYYTTILGEVRRIVYVDQAPSPPVATAEPTTGVQPLEVTFTATSSDDESSCLTHRWFFGDGAGAVVPCVPSGSPASVVHTYQDPGPYQARVEISDGGQSSFSEPISIAVGTPPLAEILEPAAGQFFRAGDTVTFRGDATDDDGTFEELQFRWTILFLHNEHEHTAAGQIPGPESSFEIPSSGHDFHDQTGFELILTVTDRHGLKDVQSVAIFPEKVDIDFDTVPAGLRLQIDDLPVRAPWLHDTLIGFHHQIRAEAQCHEGARYEFASWSDGGAAAHEIIVPDTALSLVATFTEAGSCIPENGLVLHIDAGRGVSTTAGEVTAWDDQSGSGNHLTVTGGSPTWIDDGLNGQPVIRFDGVSDALGREPAVGLPAGNADRSVFMVVRYLSKGSGGFAYGNPADNQGFGLIVAQGTGRLGIQGWGIDNDFHAPVVGEGSGWLSQGAVVGAGVYRHTRNGLVIDTGEHVWATGSGRLRIGAELDDHPAINMEVAEVLVYDRAVDEPERQQIEEFLEEKYLPAVNQPPVGGEDAAAVRPEGVVSIDILANDLDSEGDHLHGDTVGIVSQPSQGFVAGIDPETGELQYHHTGAPGVDDSFTYTVADHEGARSEPTTVHIRVLEEDFPPVGDPVLLLESTHGVDIDPSGQVLRWIDFSGRANHLAASGNPALGTSGGPSGRPFVRLDGGGDLLQRTGTLRGLPGDGDDRTVLTVVSYRASDHVGFSYGSTDEGQGCAGFGNRAFGLVADRPGKLTVQGWCAEADFHSATQGSGLGWLVQSAVVDSGSLAHFRDGNLIDTASHTFQTDTATGRIVLGVELDGSPFADMDAAAVLIYDRALSAPERLMVEAYLQNKYIGPANPAPVAADDLAVVASGGSVTVDVLANDSDDRALDPRSVRILDAPVGGTATVDPVSGAISYSHGGAAASADTFTYTVDDLTGNTSNVAIVTVQVLDTSLPAAGLVVRLESDIGVVSSGGTVSLWQDLSGRGNDLVASGNPQRLAGGLNGQVFVYLDGNDDRLQRASGLAGLPGGGDDRSVFAVVRYHSNGFGGLAWGAPASSTAACGTEGNRVFGLVVDNRGDLAVQGWCQGNDVLSGVPGTGVGWLVQSAVLETDLLRQYLDGALIDTTGHVFDTDADGRLLIGAEIDGNPPVAMDLAAFVVYDRALPEVERSEVESYLMDKYLGPVGCRLPVVGDDFRSVAIGGTVDIGVPTFGGECPENQVDILSPPMVGSVVVNMGNGKIVYTHDGGAVLDDSFTFTLSDSLGQVSEPITVFLTVLPVADGLVFHLDSSNGVIVSGDDVLAWLDLSGSANDLVATSSPKLAAAAPSGRDIVDLDGFSDRLSKTGGLANLPAGNGDRTFFLVASYRGGGYGGVTYGTPACNQVFGPIVDNRGQLGIQGWCSDFITQVLGEGAGWLVQTVRLTGEVLDHYRDGLLIDTATHSFATEPDGALVLGGEIDGSPGVPMHVAAVLIFDRALTNTERQEIEAYLQARYLAAGN